VNALWARHQWVGQGHSDGEYRALADTLRRGEISDVFFHVGPLDPDGSIPPGRYAHARALLAAMDRLAPGVRSQAYVGQVTSQGGGPLDLTRQAVRDRIVGTARTLLDLGFKGIHYDIEPVYPVDGEFLDLLERTHDLTRGRGGVLSVSLEQLELVNGMQTVSAAVLPDIHYPPRLSRSFLERVAGRVDQVAVMAYDTELPADWLVGRHFAWQAKHVTELVGDQVTVFIGVPTYAQGQPFPWAEMDRPGDLGGSDSWEDAEPCQHSGSTQWSCASARSRWCWRSAVRTGRAGVSSFGWPGSWVFTRRRCGRGSVRRKSTVASGRGRPRRSRGG